MGRKGVEVGQTNPSKNARSRLHRMLTIQSRQFFYLPFLSTSLQLWLVRSPMEWEKNLQRQLSLTRRAQEISCLRSSSLSAVRVCGVNVSGDKGLLGRLWFPGHGGKLFQPPPSPTSRTSCHHPSSGLLWGEMSHTESSTIIALCTCSLRYSTPLTPSTSSSSSSYSLRAFVRHLVGRGVNCLWIEWILLIF